MYYPIRLPEAKFSPGFLPALKKIVSTHDFTMRILRDTTVCRRTMEAIGQISLGPNTLQDLEMIDGSKLQALHLWKYDNIETVHQVAKLFPKIKFLEMPRFGVPRGEMDELIVRPSILAFHICNSRRTSRMIISILFRASLTWKSFCSPISGGIFQSHTTGYRRRPSF